MILAFPNPRVRLIQMDTISPAMFSTERLRLAAPFLINLGPAQFRRWIIDRIPHAGVQRLKNIVDIIQTQSELVYRSKKDARLADNMPDVQQAGEGKDIMSILLKANMVVSEEDRLPERELIAQMSTLIFAGMDTTSTALVKTLETLAEYPAWQEKIREEIMKAFIEFGEKDIPYDDITKLPILDAVCRETFRLHAPGARIVRQATKDTVIPLSEPVQGVDGRLLSEIVVPKGTTLHIGVRALNRSKAVWGEDAKEWKPERWLHALPEAVANANIPGVYSNMLSFGGGGYSCIGFKFAQLEISMRLI